MKPNDPETSDNIDVINICHPEKKNIVYIFGQISILKIWMKNSTKICLYYKYKTHVFFGFSTYFKDRQSFTEKFGLEKKSKNKIN